MSIKRKDRPDSPIESDIVDYLDEEESATYEELVSHATDKGYSISETRDALNALRRGGEIRARIEDWDEVRYSLER